MINKIHTPCKICIFALYNDKITQTGCKLNRLKIFKKHKVEILEAYDEEKEFYVINNMKCLHWRPENWKWSKSSQRKQQIKIDEEIAIHYNAIIFTNDNIEDTKLTLLSLQKQSLLPSNITLVRYPNSKLTPMQLMDLVKDNNIPWRVENVIQNYSDEEIINIIIPFVSATLYTTFRGGFEVPCNTFSELNKKIQDELLFFGMLLPNSTNNGMVVNQKLHTLYQGNKDTPLQQKLERDECPNLVPLSQIISTFPK